MLGVACAESTVVPYRPIRPIELRLPSLSTTSLGNPYLSPSLNSSALTGRSREALPPSHAVHGECESTPTLSGRGWGIIGAIFLPPSILFLVGNMFSIQPKSDSAEQRDLIEGNIFTSPRRSLPLPTGSICSSSFRWCFTQKQRTIGGYGCLSPGVALPPFVPERTA